jgi:hypothetical protein
MGDVVEFPAREVAPDCLPEPGNRYRPYGLWQCFQPPMLTFVFASGDMKALRYDQLEQFGFRSLSDDGKCIIWLLFGGGTCSREIVIAGCGLYPLYTALSSHRVHWVWESGQLPRAPGGQLEPVVSSITINNIRFDDTGSQ